MKKQRKLKKGLAILLSLAMVVGLMSGVGTMKVSAATAAEGYDEKGFCNNYTAEGGCSNENHTSCNGYQPATLTTGEYDIDGDGDKDNDDVAYAIENAGQLYWFAGLVNGTLTDVTQDTSANAVLIEDITVNTNVLDEDGNLASNANSFTSWTPIGNNSAVYTGTFDGQGHTISGLYYNGSEKSLVGFFGCIGKGGSVSNVGIVDSYISATGSHQYFEVGGVCGRIMNGETMNGAIRNCYYTGVVSVSSSGVCTYVGGVCGRIYAFCSITNCYHTGPVRGSSSGTDTCVGGVCGWSKGSITNCYHTGIVSGSGSGTDTYVGGVCGWTYVSVTNCYYETMEGITGGIKGADVEGQAEGKESARFNSGEVAYQLSRGTDGSVWGQDLSTANSYPVLDLDKTKTVYQVGINVACDSQGAERTGYSNTNEPINVAHIDDDKDGKCDSCGTYMDGIGAKLAGYSLSLNGNIGVNFYMELSEAIASNENAYMEFTLPNTAEKTKVYVTGTHEDGATATTSTVGGKTYYVFSCEVAAKEMTDEIQAQMIVGENEGTVYTYTVKDYADYILSHTETYGEKVVALVKAMLNYGAYSQTYFEYQTVKLANTDLAEADKALGDLEAATLSGYKAAVTKNEAVCTFASAYLTLKSETAVNVYVKLADGVSEENVTFKIDDSEIAKEKLVKGTGTYEGYYILSVDNIQASALDDMHTFTVTTGGQTASLSYGPMSYCYSVIGSDTASDGLKNVVKALYAFNQAADSYVAN